MGKRKKKKKHSHDFEKPSLSRAREEIYQTGLSHFRDGKYEQAIDLWGRIVGSSGPKLSVQLAEAHFRSAISNYSTQNIKAVISGLLSALKYNPTQPVYLFHMGLAYDHIEKFSQSISYYLQAVKYAPDNERYRYHLGLAYLKSGDAQKSLEIFSAIKGARGRIGEALAYISLGDCEHALEILSSAHSPDEYQDSETKFLTGVIYLTQEKAEEAKAFLKMSANDGIANGVADYYLGLAYARTSALPSAIKAWETAAKKGSNVELIRDEMAKVYRQLVVRYFDRGDLDRVVGIWEKLLEIDPEDREARKNLVHAYFLRGNDYAKSEQFEHAIRYWKKAWELDQESANIAHNLALAYEKQDKLSESAKYWRAAAQEWKRQLSSNYGKREILRAHMCNVHVHLADIALRMDDIGRAILEYIQALRYDPENVEVILKLGELYVVQEKFDLAARQFSSAHRLRPTDKSILQSLAYVYAMKGDIKRSIESVKAILKIDPKDRSSQEMLVQYYLDHAEDAMDMGNSKSAFAYLNEGLELFPNNIELRAFIGAVYLSKGDKASAESVFNEAIEADPQDPKTYIVIGRHYLNEDLPFEAEGYFSKAVKLSPDDHRVYIDIAAEYCEIENCKQAQKYFKMAKNTKPNDAGVVADIVEHLIRWGCSEYSLKYAKDLVSIAPHDPKSYLLLARACNINRKVKDALRALEKGMKLAKDKGDNRILEEMEEILHFLKSEIGKVSDLGIFLEDTFDDMDDGD